MSRPREGGCPHPPQLEPLEQLEQLELLGSRFLSRSAGEAPLRPNYHRKVYALPPHEAQSLPNCENIVAKFSQLIVVPFPHSLYRGVLIPLFLYPTGHVIAFIYFTLQKWI